MLQSFLSVDDVVPKAVPVSDFMLSLSQRDNALEVPYDDFCYAEALLRWEADKRNPMSFFSTADEFMLQYRVEISKMFGLEIVTHEEAARRKQIQKCRTMGVVGYNPAESKELT